MLPSWDLFIVSFIIIVLSFSIIIGLLQTIKIILNTYIGIIISEGIGESIKLYLNSKFFFLKDILDLGTFTNDYFFIVLKIIIFIFAVIFLTLLPIYNMELAIPSSKFLKNFLNITYGILLSLLFIIVILIYLSGYSILSSNMTKTSEIFLSLIEESKYAYFIMQSAPFLILISFVLIIHNAFKTKKD